MYSGKFLMICWNEDVVSNTLNSVLEGLLFLGQIYMCGVCCNWIVLSFSILVLCIALGILVLFIIRYLQL